MRFPTILLALTRAGRFPPPPAPPRACSPPRETNLTEADAVKRTCAARLLSADRRGIARESWKAPMSGFVNVRLSGARKADWDLAVFDAASRRPHGLLAGLRLDRARPDLGDQRTAARDPGLPPRAARAESALEMQLVDVAPPKHARHALARPREARERRGPAPARGARPRRHPQHPGRSRGHRAEQRGRPRRCSQKNGFGFTTRIADLAASYDQSRAADVAYANRLSGKANLPSGNRTSYRELADYELELKQLAETFPKHVKPVTLPQADDRRPGDRRRRDRGQRQPPRGRATRLLHRRHAPRARVARRRGPDGVRAPAGEGLRLGRSHHDAARQGARRDRADPQQGRLPGLARGRQDVLAARPLQRGRRLRELP